MSELKTSKIKEVKAAKEWQGKNGFVNYYHDLVMENGDKINLGKKTIQEVGTELSYRIVEGGSQQEFQKAKPANPDYEAKFGNNGTSFDPQTGITTKHNYGVPITINANDKMSKEEWAEKDKRKQILISRQSALKGAIDFCRNQDCPIEHVLEQATIFHHFQMTGEILETPKVPDFKPF